MADLFKLDFVLPTDLTLQLLTGAVFAESSTLWVGGEDDDEKEAIAWTILNMSYYASHVPEGKKRCYNASFGDGTALSAIKKSIYAYDQARWKMVMNGTVLKSEATLARELKADDKEHLRACVTVVNNIGISTKLPHAMATMEGKIPVQFNQAKDAPPSDRQEKVGRLGRHTFYGFKTGMECE